LCIASELLEYFWARLRTQSANHVASKISVRSDHSHTSVTSVWRHDVINFLPSLNIKICASGVTVVDPLMALTALEPLCECGSYRCVLQLFYKLQCHEVNLILRSNLSRTDTFSECSVCRSDFYTALKMW